MKRLVCAIAAAAMLLPGTALAREFVMGIVGPETGNLAQYGVQTLMGAQMAVDEINASGGINGARVELVNYDNRGDKAESTQAVNRLVTRDDALAIIGCPTSGATLAVSPLAERSQVLLISAGSTMAGITDGKQYTFRNTLLDSVGGPATVTYVQEELGKKRWAIITSINNDYSVGLSDVFRQAIEDQGGEIVAETQVSDGDVDFSAQITSLKPSNPEAIAYTGYYPEAALIAKEAQKQGIDAFLVGGDGLQAPDLYKVGGDATLGTILYSGFSPQGSADYIRKFVDKFSDRYDEAPDMFAAQGYDAAYLIKAAFEEAGENDSTQAVQKLRNLKDFPGVSGKTSYNDSGDPEKRPFIQKVVRDGDGYMFKLVSE